MGARFSSSLWIPTSGSTTQIEEVGYTPASGFQDSVVRSLGVGQAAVGAAGTASITCNGANNNTPLSVTKSPAGAQSGDAVSITMGTTASGRGINLVAGTSNACLRIAGNTGTSTSSSLITALQTYTVTSGTVNSSSFAPTFSDSGTNSTTTARGLYINTTVNYTAGSKTGSVTALQIDQVETSNPTGTNNLISARSGAAGTTGVFAVNRLGGVSVGAYASSSVAGATPDASIFLYDNAAATLPLIYIEQDPSSATATFQSNRYSTTAANGTLWNGYRGRGNSGAPSSVSNNDVLFQLTAIGASNTGGSANAARISMDCDAAPASARTPGRIVFYTSNTTALLNDVARFTNAGEFKAVSGSVWGWTASASDSSGAFDTTISRRAAGQVSFDTTAAGNGLGAFFASRVQVDRTTDLSVTAAATNTVYTNTGAGGTVNFTLPTAAVGLQYTFIVNAAQTLQVTAGASTTITIGNTASAAAGNITNASVGSAVTLHAVSTTSWIASSATGTWTVT